MLGFRDKTRQDQNHGERRLLRRRGGRVALIWLIIPSMWLVALAPRASAEPQKDAASAPAEPSRASETQPSGPPASARDSSETDRQVEAARAHFFRGVEYYEAGDYRSALLEFRRAFEISRNYRILYNLGRVNHELSQYADAIEAYETYLSTGRDEVAEERRAEVERDLDSLRSRTARLTVTVNVREAEVLVDNRVVGKSPLPKAIRLDAGEHFITVRLDGYGQEQRRIVVGSGDTVKERLDLSEQRRAALPSASAKLNHSLASAPEPSSSASTFTTVAWIGTGTLAAAAGVTGVLAWVEADRLAQLRDTPGSSPDERSKLQSRGKLLATTSDVLTAAAVVAGATALYLTLSSSDDSPTKDSGVATLGLRGSQLVFSYSH